MLRNFPLYCTTDVNINTCEISADSVSVVLEEEERFELNLEELVLDSGQETGARAVQLGVWEKHLHRTDISLSDLTSALCVHYISSLGALYKNGIQKPDGFMPCGGVGHQNAFKGSGFHLEN